MRFEKLLKTDFIIMREKSPASLSKELLLEAANTEFQFGRQPCRGESGTRRWGIRAALCRSDHYFPGSSSIAPPIRFSPASGQESPNPLDTGAR